MTEETVVYHRPRLLTDKPMHYCPGCSHSAINKILADTIADMGLEDSVIGVSPVGCAVLIYDYISIDWVEAAHGRAPAVATAISRLRRDRLVFTYQGDGDLSAIGISEAVHAATRGENITIIFVNNALYGMTGGQMAPTTPIDMKTVTCPKGRDAATHGHPLDMLALLASLPGVCFATRENVLSPTAVRRAARSLRTAFENTLERRGTSVIEFMAACPTNWKMSPIDAVVHLTNRLKTLKTGRIK